MRFGSVCSGIEAASVAWHPLGMRAAWFAEIEPFPCSVLAHHYPTVPNMGDMTKLAGYIRAGYLEVPDVLVGGTPCQAFSVAGLRAGLADSRGQLTLSFGDLANAIDEQRPGDECVIVWENVPGVLSDKTNAFGCFLALLAGENTELVSPGGKWPNAGVVYGPQRTIAWRVMDAQYVGVAQRRRRVFVVASARHGFDPAAVLFEFDGVRRDTAPRRETREDIAGRTGAGAAAYGGNNQSGPIDVATARNACGSSTGRLDFESETFLVQAVCVTGDVTHCLKAEGFDASEDGTGRGQPIVAFVPTVLDEVRLMGGDGELCGALAAQPGMKQQTFVSTGMAVRRMTPVECERLQAFRDHYTAVPHRDKPAADGPRYKALGNSMCTKNMRWIGARIIMNYFN